jgi:maltodextrin utilization protein YvdJ
MNSCVYRYINYTVIIMMMMMMMMMMMIIIIICFIPLKVLFLFLNRASKIMVFRDFRQCS